MDNHIAKAKNKTCPLCRGEIEITPTIRQEYVRPKSVPFVSTPTIVIVYSYVYIFILLQIFLGLFFHLMIIPFGIFAVIVSPLLAPITLVLSFTELIWKKCAGQELSTGNLTKSLGYFAIAIIITVLAVYDIIPNPIVNGQPFSFWWCL